MIRTLDRYVMVEFLKYLTLAMCLFIGLFIIVDLFEKLSKFVDNTASITDIAAFYAYSIPYTVVLTMPMAMLLASLMLIGQLGRTGELVAMLSAGVSFLRILSPVLVLSGLLSVGNFALAEWVMPDALEKKDVTLNEKIRGKSGDAGSRKRNFTYMGRGDRLYWISTVDPARKILRDVVVQTFDEERRVTERIDAREATFVDPAWVFRSGYLRSGMPDAEHVVPFKRLWVTTIPERPEDFMSKEPDPMNMGRAALGRYIDRLKEARARTRKLEVNYHLKLAYPLINFIIVLLGASLSVRIRRTGWALGLGLSMFIGFAYYAFIRFGQAMGFSGAIPPLLAAWLGNIVFLGVAVTFQVRANR